jgi:hypothetical protein
MSNSKFQKSLPLDRKTYEKTMKDAEKIILQDKTLQGTSIDPKRQISYGEKEYVWNQSISHNSFSPEIFRCDPLGAVAIKYLTYKNTSVQQRKFAYEYEHIVSHSRFGKSVPQNICILNAGINRSKGKKPMTGVDFYEFKGLVSHYALTFDELLDFLEDDLHGTCEYYNLYFYKNNQGKWSIHKNGNTYQGYSRSYKPKRIKFHINRENLAAEAALGLAVIGAVVVVADFVGSSLCIFGGNVVNFFDKTFNQQPPKASEALEALEALEAPKPTDVVLKTPEALEAPEAREAPKTPEAPNELYSNCTKIAVLAAIVAAISQNVDTGPRKKRVQKN